MAYGKETSRRVGSEVILTTMLAGVSGGLFITVVLAAARASGLITLNLERSFGVLLLGETGPGAWMLGLVLHLAFSAIFALFYAEGFRLVHRANWKVGAAFGILHWAAVGAFIGVLPTLRPMVAALMEAPGPFALNKGLVSFFFLLAAHLGFGMILGTAYRRSAEMHPEIFEARA